MLKKSVILAIIVVLLIITISVIAENPTNATVSAVSNDNITEVKTFINGTEIKGYNMNGQLVIPVEELRYFEFLVNYNEDDKKLNLVNNNLPPALKEPYTGPEPKKIETVKSGLNAKISGRVLLPDGKVAPKGGLVIQINAGIVPGPMVYDVPRGESPFPINDISITIPEGKNNASYEIPVVTYFKLDNKEYAPKYELCYSFSYNLDGEYRAELDYSRRELDVSNGDISNVDFTFKNYDINWFK